MKAVFDGLGRTHAFAPTKNSRFLMLVGADLYVCPQRKYKCLSVDFSAAQADHSLYPNMYYMFPNGEQSAGTLLHI